MRRSLLCLLGRHEPAEYAMRRGRLKDIESGAVPATLEYRCRRCMRELERPNP